MSRSVVTRMRERPPLVDISRKQPSGSMKRRRLPSGDQDGFIPTATLRALPPSTGMISTRRRHSNQPPSGACQVALLYAIDAPSGDHVGPMQTTPGGVIRVSFVPSTLIGGGP